MVRFGICDDEPVLVEELSGLISDYMKERQMVSYDVCKFGNGTSLLESRKGFDIIFLDIRMEELNGMETARRLRQEGEKSLLIFVTAFKEWVFDAFEVQAYDYLVKPLDTEHFKRTMDRAMRVLGERVKSLLIQKGNSCQVILQSEIVYCEVWGRKVYVHEKNGNTIDYYERLEELEKRLDSRFFRCHRSYLVNLDYVRGCKDGQVLLSQEKKLPVSRLRERDLTQAILRHMKERSR